MGDPLAQGSLLLTVLRRSFWCTFYFVLIEVGVSCILYSIVSYSYVKVKSMQRSGTEAIRTKIKPSKPKLEIINITISQNTK